MLIVSSIIGVEIRSLALIGIYTQQKEKYGTSNDINQFKPLKFSF
jgi:hypothetical protein